MLVRLRAMCGYKEVKAIESRVKSASFRVNSGSSRVKPARADVN